MIKCMNRFEKVQGILKELKGEGWLIICTEDSDVHSRFLLGVGSHARHYIFIAVDGKHKVFAVEMEAPMIRKSLKRKGVQAEVIAYRTMEELKSYLSPLIQKPRIAINYGEDVLSEKGTPYADYLRVGDFFSVKNLAPKTDFFSAAPIIYQLRSIKSPEELKDLRNVCKANIELLEKIPEWVKVGMTEREVKANLEYEYMKIGKPSFEAIVGNGPHSADPHHNTSNKKIKPGVLLIDSGLQIDEMCSDITWTFWIGKNPSDDFIKAYHALYKAKMVANKYYIDGSPNNLPAKKCRESLAESGYDHEKYYFHGLGHPLDFEVHGVGARISWKVSDDYILKENMVYTNEPGLYWADKWGVRLEDDIIIGKDKCEQVTYNSKEPILI